MKVIQVLIPLLLTSFFSYAQSITVEQDSVTRIKLDCSIKDKDFPSPLWIIVHKGKMFSIDSTAMKKSRMNPKFIKSFSVLKDKEGIERYGNAAKNGVVEIVLNEKNNSSQFKSLKKDLRSL